MHWSSAGISLLGGVIGGFCARLAYEHYIHWRIERRLMLAREIELLALRARLAQQLRGLGGISGRSR